MPFVANRNIQKYLQIPIRLNLCWLMFEVIRSVSLVYSDGLRSFGYKVVSIQVDSIQIEVVSRHHQS